MASPLKKAKDRLSIVQQKLTLLHEEESELLTTVRVLERMKTEEDFTDLDKEFSKLSFTASGAKRDRKNRIVVAQAVTGLLSDGKARSTGQIVQALEAQNVPIAGKNKVAYVSQILSRERTKFAASRKSGWTLRTVVPFGKTA